MVGDEEVAPEHGLGGSRIVEIVVDRERLGIGRECLEGGRVSSKEFVGRDEG
ncbi:unannotated protein [freshwater metagenome]|uniref:Unannotated protein n=1 Tax=freshwater metagenome TaxID=449393 RepID=A0A6J7PLL8_9ZZZZ